MPFRTLRSFERAVLIDSVLSLLSRHAMFSHLYLPASAQAVVTDVIPSPPRYMPAFLSRRGFSIPTAHRRLSAVAMLVAGMHVSAWKDEHERQTYTYP